MFVVTSSRSNATKNIMFLWYVCLLHILGKHFCSVVTIRSRSNYDINLKLVLSESWSMLRGNAVASTRVRRLGRARCDGCSAASYQRQRRFGL